MKKQIWRERAEIYWCRNCNIPLITPKCEICGEIGRKISATPPIDARPAFKEDEDRIRRTIRMEYEDNRAEKALIDEGKIILLNKIPHVDQADEIIVDGRVIGQIYYEPRMGIWRFKPVEEGATRLIMDEAGYWCRIRRERIEKWDRISRSEIIDGEIPDRQGKMIAIGNMSGKSIGVGVYEDDEIKVIKAWEPQSPHILKVKATLDKALEANSKSLELLEARAKSFIIEAERKYGRPIYTSFSGGKDSLATLLLSMEAGVDQKMLFNDTGLELPETISYVDEVSRNMNVELIKAEAKDVFWSAVEVFGPPARDYRWCCKTCKLIPILKAMKENYPSGALTLVGQRKYESLTRAKSPSIWKNKWLPNSINASPIMDWSSLHVWLYVMWKKAPINPLYQMGFDRLGCWLCPSCELAEFKLVEKIHPELWGKWEGKLMKWAKERGYSEEWVKMGLWRWIKIPGDQRRMAKERNITIDDEHGIKRLPAKIVKISGYSPCQESYSIEAKLDVEIDLERIKDVLPIIGEVKYSKKLGIATITMGKNNATITPKGQLTVISKSKEDAEAYFKSTLKAILRGMYCIKCGSCQYICEANAIKISDHPIVDEDKCVKCGKCQLNCPLAEYTSKIIVEGICI